MIYWVEVKVDLWYFFVVVYVYIGDVVGFVCWCEYFGCVREVFFIFFVLFGYFCLVLLLCISIYDLILIGVID